MKHFKLWFAFVLGWAVVTALGLAADAAARHGGDATKSPRLIRINALRRRVAYLEQKSKGRKLATKVVAPFEVVNRAGQRIFYVGLDREVELYHGGKRVAVMSPAGGFGTLWALYNGSFATLTPRGFSVKENDQVTVELAKDSAKNNYRLEFSNGDKTIAAIGVSSVSNSGIALVSDGSGSQKADMSAPNDYGVVEVGRGYGFTAARLTESNGGYFIACSILGCGQPAVEAGDGGGYGVVRTGPAFYVQGPTGAPGSFLVGKKQ
jgi:hypothetical protein